MKWSHSVALGRRLFNSAGKNSEVDPEAYYRAAISRAYFGAYHEVKIALEACTKLDFMPGRSKDHHLQVVTYLEEQGAALEQLAGLLNMVREARRVADYEAAAVRREETDRIIDLCHRIIEEVPAAFASVQ